MRVLHAYIYIHMCMSLAVLYTCMFQLPSSTWNVSFHNPQDTAPLPSPCCTIIGMLRDALKTPLTCIYITLGTVLGLPLTPCGYLKPPLATYRAVRQLHKIEKDGQSSRVSTARGNI